MNKIALIGFIILTISTLALLLTGCNKSCKKDNSKSDQTTIEAQSTTPDKIKTVMTAQMQEQITPGAVLEDLLEGNKRYMADKLENRDLPAQVSATTNGQYPKAVVLACIDSRVPVEYIFDQGVGDIFVARVAGNIENAELLGSIEYGLGVAGSKLLMVLGHENCGAVKSAIKKVDVGSDNVTALLNTIEPAIQATEGERDIEAEGYFENVIKNNVHLTIENIRKKSNIVKSLEEEGKIKVVGAYYSLTDGKVTVIE